MTNESFNSASLKGASVPNASVLDVLAWICVKERKVLMVRTHGKTVFYLPGGKREIGESDWQALSREISEEVNVALLPESLAEIFLIEEVAHGYVETTQVRMKCFQADYIGDIIPSSEIAEIAWFTLENRYDCAPASQRVLEKLHKQGLID